METLKLILYIFKDIILGLIGSLASLILFYKEAEKEHPRPGRSNLYLILSLLNIAYFIASLIGAPLRIIYNNLMN